MLHATAVCPNEAGGLSVIRVESEDAPRSADDRFVLGLARARVDAIITSSANLRAEPRLLHRLHGDSDCADALRAWSHHEDDARVFILTRSGDVPAEHGVLSERPSPTLLTGACGATRARQLGIAAASIEERADPSIRDAVAYVLATSATAVLIETGPSNARRLYEQPIVIDELMLSVCHDAVSENAIGPELFDAEATAKLKTELLKSEFGWPDSGWSFARLWPRDCTAFI